jgi:hypothetical protein
MSRKAKPCDEAPCTARLANYHLDAWREFVRLTPEEQSFWEQRQQYITRQKTLTQLLLSKTKTNSRIVQCITTGEFFSSLSETAKHFKVSKQALCRALKEQKAVKGFKFKYVKEEKCL